MVIYTENRKKLSDDNLKISFNGRVIDNKCLNNNNSYDNIIYPNLNIKEIKIFDVANFVKNNYKFDKVDNITNSEKIEMLIQKIDKKINDLDK